MISYYISYTLDLLVIFILTLSFFSDFSFLKLILLLEGGLVFICMFFLTLSYFFDNTFGQIFAIFILGAAAGETALGLSIFVKAVDLKEQFL